MSIGLALGTQLGRTGRSGATVLHRSTFTAPDGTALGAYVPEVGNAWTALAGTWTIQGNAARATAGSQYASTPMGASDLIVAGTLRYMTGTRALGLIVRASDVANLWLAYLEPTTLKLWEMVASVLTLRGTVTVAAGAPNTDYRLAVRANGPTIDVYLDGTQRLTYASATSNQPVQIHGMCIGGNNANQGIRNVIALPVSANPATA